jgi:ATP-dependent helicase/nuclease subunit A
MTRDEKSRHRILSDFQTTLFVEAGAGSGKTTAMVSRIMKIIVTGLADIREIVAITFTNEGAASLKSKILQELEVAADRGAYAPPGSTAGMLMPEQLERVRKAMHYLPLAAFSTIHAFCLSMLKERPVEAGIDPKFDMNTEGNVIPPLAPAWMAYLLECARQNDPFMKFALGNGVDLDAVGEMARIRCANPDLTLYHEDAPAVTAAEVKKAFTRAEELVQTMHDNIGVIESDRPSGARDRRLEFVRGAHRRISSARVSGRLLETLIAMKVHDNWPQKLYLHGKAAAELSDICEDIHLRHANHLHHHCALFVGKFVEWFERYKRTTSSLYFDDLLFMTREMLRTNREVREYFKRRYRYLFIDETQDTDPLQTEIVFFLSEKDDQFATCWAEVQLAPSKLFVVGDPKQSIFKFRRADITMYEEAKDIVRRQGGEVLYLERNFRSAPAIIEFVNRHFEDSFNEFRMEQDLKIHPMYVPLTVGVDRYSKLPSHVYAVTSPDRGNVGRRDLLALEGEKVISFIRHITAPGSPKIYDPAEQQHRPVRLSDIMILMRIMTDVGVYEQMLEDADIPHYQVGGKTFFITEDIRGLVFALQAIDDPTNTMALFGALKSPVFGFSDQALFEFVSTGRRLSVFAVKDDTQTDAVSVVLRLLRSLHYRRERLLPSGVLKEVFNASGLCHAVMTEANGPQKSARYFRLLELVYEIEADRPLSFRSVVDRLLQVMDLDDPQLANVTLERSVQNAVKITTIHKAKGLEAPVVILANSGYKSRKPDPDSVVLRDEGKIVIPYSKVGGFYSKDRAALLKFEAARERCEEERLRYVAATRARDMLVICVPSAEQGQETFNGYLAPSLMLNPLVQPVKVQELPEQTPLPGRSVDLQQVFDNAKAEQKKGVEELGNAVSTLASPFVSVHEVMEVDESVFKMKRISRGKAYGNVLHRIMQHYVSVEAFDVEAILDEWMEQEGLPRRYRNDLLSSFNSLQQHPRVVEARSSAERYCEWEFFVNRDGRIINGVIDLVYRNPNGEWVIVDYKTDDVTDPERKTKLDELYGRQLAEYAHAFEGIIGVEVSRTELVYTEVSGIGKEATN